MSPIALLHPSVVILLIGSRPRHPDTLLFAITPKQLVDESSVVVRVNLPNAEWNSLTNPLDRLLGGVLCSGPNWLPFPPSTGNVSQRQCMDVVASITPAAVFHIIGLQVAHLS